MGLADKSEGEEQLMPNNSDEPNEDQGEEIQQPEEGSEHKEQAHGHPDVDCLHVGHLQHPPMEQSAALESSHGPSSGLPAHINCLLFFSFILNFFWFLKKLFMICPIV